MLPPAPGVSTRTNEILSELNSDTVSRIVKSDPILRTFAEKLTNKHGHDADQSAYIRQRVRELGRMVLEYRNITGDENAHMPEVMKPANFVHVVDATRRAAGFCEDTNLYKSLSLPLKIGCYVFVITQRLK